MPGNEQQILNFLKMIKILCFMGIHDYKTLNIEFGFGPTDRVQHLSAKDVVTLQLKEVNKKYLS